MKPFQYVTASTADSALELCGKKDMFLAGGTDLLGEIKDFVVMPGRVIDVKNLPGTREIVETETGWKLGANVTIAEIAAHKGLGKALLPKSAIWAHWRAILPSIRAAGITGIGMSNA